MISMRNLATDYDTKSEGRENQMSDSEEQKPEVGTFFVAGMLVAVVACIVDVVAMALPWWTYSTRSDFGTETRTHAGLWSLCRDITPAQGETTQLCSNIADPEAYVENARTCNTAGLILMGLGVVISLTYRLWQTHLHLLLYIGGVMFNVAGLLTWVVAVVYSAEYSKMAANSPKELHAACYLSLVAGLTYHVVAILAVLLTDRNKASVQPQRRGTLNNFNL